MCLQAAHIRGRSYRQNNGAKLQILHSYQLGQ